MFHMFHLNNGFVLKFFNNIVIVRQYTYKFISLYYKKQTFINICLLLKALSKYLTFNCTYVNVVK